MAGIWQMAEKKATTNSIGRTSSSFAALILISIWLQMKVQPWVSRWVISFWRVVGQFLKISYLMRRPGVSVNWWVVRGCYWRGRFWSLPKSWRLIASNHILFAKSCLSEVVRLPAVDFWVAVVRCFDVSRWVGCNQVALSVAGLHVLLVLFVLHVLLMFACALPRSHSLWRRRRLISSPRQINQFKSNCC